MNALSLNVRMELVGLLLLGLVGVSFGRITPEECEDAEFHLDPDNCPHSFFRCYKNADVSI